MTKTPDGLNDPPKKKPIDHLRDQEKADKKYWLKPDEACVLIRCGKTTLWKLRNKGLVDSSLDGTRRKYVKASVYAYIAQGAGRAG
jgi:hypothetical protein